jgi:uncharacterized membrane protein YeiH
MEIFSYINIGGTIAFVASGTLAGIRQKLDIFGILVIAFVTAIGGGTLRDLLIGQSPVKWLMDVNIIYLIVGVSLATILFRKYIDKLDKTLLFFDTLGLAFFTIRGIEVGLETQLSTPSCIILGTITACFGGVIRDILLNEVPTIFSKEIYATACIVGGISFFVFKNFDISQTLLELLTFIIIIGIRFFAIKTNFTLPKIEK